MKLVLIVAALFAGPALSEGICETAMRYRLEASEQSAERSAWRNQIRSELEEALSLSIGTPAEVHIRAARISQNQAMIYDLKGSRKLQGLGAKLLSDCGLTAD
ncbi:hypothetical protein ACM25O_09035 [Sulfitobacter pontiacus]